VSQSFKLNLLFLDRIGIVADISRRVADQAMNIVSMEVQRKQQLADVYLEADPVTREMSGKDILKTLSGLDGLQSIRFIKTEPGTVGGNRGIQAGSILPYQRAANPSAALERPDRRHTDVGRPLLVSDELQTGHRPAIFIPRSIGQASPPQLARQCPGTEKRDRTGVHFMRQHGDRG
jgi:hypothetical protein